MSIVQVKGKVYPQLIEHPEYGFMLNPTVDSVTGDFSGIKPGVTLLTFIMPAVVGDPINSRTARFATWKDTGQIGEFDMNGVGVFGTDANNRLNQLDVSGALDAHGNSYDFSIDAEQPNPAVYLLWTMTINTTIER